MGPARARAEEGEAMLKDKYQAAVNELQASAKNAEVREEGGKLHLKGTTEYQMQANRVWDEIKTVPSWANEIVADIRAERTDIFGIYTVKPGDTLSKLAKVHFGDANRYMDIFNANKDQLSDPNMIKVGQKLKLPNR
jgi:nucleoid-associated protein YgaU